MTLEELKTEICERIESEQEKQSKFNDYKNRKDKHYYISEGMLIAYQIVSDYLDDLEVWYKLPKRKHISKSTRLKVYEKYNGHCAYCGCELALKEMQVDHIQSVYWYDGANDIENYNPACRMCNFYKSTMTVEDFRGQLGKLTSRLEKTFIYRLAKKYGVIQEVEKPIVFYFERGRSEKWRIYNLHYCGAKWG